MKSERAESQEQSRESLKAVSGLLLATFAALLSSTVVATALPSIVGDLGGSQANMTWVMVSTMLVATITTPIWGKSADLFNKKLLVQAALVLYATGALASGLAPNIEIMIASRAFQGLGVGGLTALVQIVIASMVVPRKRGRYFGYLGAVVAVATVSGPLVGGLVVDSPLGWRGCFFVVLPVAFVAFGLLHFTLRLPAARTGGPIDFLGAAAIAGGTSLLLLWVTMMGSTVVWPAGASVTLVVAGLAFLGAAVMIETRMAADPIIPPHLFKNRTVNLVIVIAAVAGMAMFATTVYLSQYLQMARGLSPTGTGLMLVAMVGGVFVASLVSGRRITTTGRWKRWIVGGSASVAGGFILLSTLDAQTHWVAFACYLLLTGLGLGAVTQNQVLAAQNSVQQADVGAVSGVVNFFRIMGALLGIAVLGTVLSMRTKSRLHIELERAVDAGSIDSTAADFLAGGNGLPEISALAPDLRQVYEHAFGAAIGDIFLVTVPVVVIALLCSMGIKEIPLRQAP